MKPTFYLWLAAALISAIPARSATTDPSLSVALRRTNQNVVLSWFGVSGVQYQVEGTVNNLAGTAVTQVNIDLGVSGTGGTDTFSVGPGVTALIAVTTNQ